MPTGPGSYGRKRGRPPKRTGKRKKKKDEDTNNDSGALKKLSKEFNSVFKSWKSTNVPPKYYRGNK